MALTYPRCYKGEEWYNRPYICGPGKDLTWVKYDSDEELQKITSWTSSGYPLTLVEHIPEIQDLPYGPPLSGMGSDDPQDKGPGFWDNLKLFFEAGNKATNAAKVVGYATIAVVGGGLLLWYVPRTKR